MPYSPYGYYGNMPYGHLHGNMTEKGCDDPFWWVYGECFPFDNHHHRINWW